MCPAAFSSRRSAITLWGGLLIALCLAPVAPSAQADDAASPAEPDQNQDQLTEPAPAPEGLYRHVVLFQFKDGTDDETIASIEQAFAALPAEIDTIIDFEWGTNVSPEGLDDGLTHCFLVTFADAAGLEAYLPHPAHKRFVDLLRPHLERAVVVDYVSR